MPLVAIPSTYAAMMLFSVRLSPCTVRTPRSPSIVRIRTYPAHDLEYQPAEPPYPAVMLENGLARSTFQHSFSLTPWAREPPQPSRAVLQKLGTDDNRAQHFPTAGFLN